MRRNRDAFDSDVMNIDQFHCDYNKSFQFSNHQISDIVTQLSNTTHMCGDIPSKRKKKPSIYNITTTCFPLSMLFASFS